MTFEGDGSITFVDGETGEQVSAGWEVDGDQLTMRWQDDDGDSATKTTTYHADQEVMFLFALGTWAEGGQRRDPDDPYRLSRPPRETCSPPRTGGVTSRSKGAKSGGQPMARRLH